MTDSVTMAVVGKIVSPQKRYGAVLTLGTYECDYTLKRHLCLYNQVKMRSYWIRAGANPVTSILINEGKYGHGQRQDNTM